MSTDALSLDDELAVDRVRDEYADACEAAAQNGAAGPDLAPFLDGLSDHVAAVVRGQLLPTVPGYVVRGEIGRGGMSRVLRATEEGTGRDVAIKDLGGAELERVDRLVELLSNLRHPHIVPIDRVIRHDGSAYVVMPFIQGGSLRASFGRCSKAGCPPGEVPARMRRIAGLVAALAEAVRHLHDRAILHRDLKPDNVLLDGDAPLVCDLNLARATAGDGLTRPGVAVGTPNYMAPEQLAGNPDLTVAVDIYAVGAILYELLTGQPPAPDHARPPPALNRLLPADDDLAWVALECLHRDPARRPRADSLLSMLRDVQAGRPPRGEPVMPDRWRDHLARWWDAEMKEPGYVRSWARALRTEAATCLLAHTVVFVLLSAAAPAWTLWLCVLGGDTVLGWVIWAWLRGRKERVLTPMESDISYLWAAASVGEVILFALH